MGDSSPSVVTQRRVSSAEEAVKLFLPLFKEHLDNTSSLGPTTIEVSVRMMGDLLKHSIKGEEEVNGMTLVGIFSLLGGKTSFITRRGGALSGSYCAKIITSCKKALGLLRDRRTPERWRVEASVADATDSILSNVLQRYRKIEKRERAASRERKESTVLTPQEVNQILDCKSVGHTLEDACKALDDGFRSFPLVNL